MQITRVETLGDLVAYKPKEIQVLGTVYDKVPQEFREDFEVVLNTAKDMYDTGVKEAKDKGEKPKSAALKKESIDKIIKPFLQRFGIEQKVEHQRVIRTSNPRIPSDNEKISVRGSDRLVEVEGDLDEMLGDLFDTFDSESMSDEVQVNIDLQDVGVPVLDGGSSADDLFEGDEFDFEGLLDE